MGFDTNPVLLRGMLQAPGPRLRRLTVRDDDEDSKPRDVDILAILHMLGSDASIPWRSSLTTLELYCCSWYTPVIASADMFMELKTSFLALRNLVYCSSAEQLHPATFLAIVDAMAFGGLKKLKEIDVRYDEANTVLMVDVWQKYGNPRRELRISRGRYYKNISRDWMERQQKLEQQGP